MSFRITRHPFHKIGAALPRLSSTNSRNQYYCKRGTNIYTNKNNYSREWEDNQKRYKISVAHTEELDNIQSIKVSSPEDMEFFGTLIADIQDIPIGAGDTVCLTGDLGSGKTCIARGIIRFLTGDPNLRVSSPSYLLDNTYECVEDDKKLIIHHMDLYRLKDDKALHMLGFPTVLKKDLCLIEWPERLGKYLPQDRLELDIETGEGDSRYIKLKPHGKFWLNRINLLLYGD